MTMTYREQLLHPFWQKKRLQRLEAAGWTCEHCAAVENTLHVHHKRYVKGRMAWEYDDAELTVLCNQCHLDEHALEALLDEMLSTSTGWETLQTVVGLVAGYLGFHGDIQPELVQRARCAAGHGFYSGVIAGAASLSNVEQGASFIRRVHEEFAGGAISPSPVAAAMLTELDARAAGIRTMQQSTGEADA